MDLSRGPVIREAIAGRMDTDLGYPTWDERHSPPLPAGAFAERMERKYPASARVAGIGSVVTANAVAVHLIQSREWKRT